MAVMGLQPWPLPDGLDGDFAWSLFHWLAGEGGCLWQVSDIGPKIVPGTWDFRFSRIYTQLRGQDRTDRKAVIVPMELYSGAFFRQPEVFSRLRLSELDCSLEDEDLGQIIRDDGLAIYSHPLGAIDETRDLFVKEAFAWGDGQGPGSSWESVAERLFNVIAMTGDDGNMVEIRFAPNLANLVQNAVQATADSILRHPSINENWRWSPLESKLVNPPRAEKPFMSEP